VVTAGRGDMSIDLTIRDEKKHTVWSKTAVDHGKFNFVTSDHVDHHPDDDDYDYDDYSDAETWGTHKYEFCFVARSPANPQDSHHLRRRVSLKLLSGESARDYTELAKEEHLSRLELTLRQMGDELQELLTELDVVKNREAQLRDLNERTHSTVVSYSIASCGFMIAVGMYQAYYLRNFFRKKKLV